MADICAEDKKMKYHYNDFTIFYSVSGTGPALVLLHGFLESSAIWNRLIPELSDRYTVIILDLPGHGKSETIDEIHSMELLAEVVNNLLGHLEIETVGMVGHSMGGYVALAFAELFPRKLAGLVLLNSTAVADSKERKENRTRALRLLEMDKKSFIGMAISNLFTEETRLLFPTEIESLKIAAYSFPNKGIMANIKGMRDRKDRTHILKQLTAKKWIIAGTKDPIVPLSQIKLLSAATHTPLYTVKGSHMSWLENEEEIVKIMLFIDFFDI